VIASNKNATKFFGALILGVFFPTAAFCQHFGYVNPLNAKHTISIQISPAFFAAGDRAISAEFCSPLEPYVCLSSAEFSFAFPRARQHDVLKWEYKGHTYNLIGQEKLRVFGSTIKVWVVESIQGEQKIRYSYSDRQGLLAFSIQLNDAGSTFLSMGKVGFGHQRNPVLPSAK